MKIAYRLEEYLWIKRLKLTRRLKGLPPLTQSEKEAIAEELEEKELQHRIREGLRRL